MSTQLKRTFIALLVFMGTISVVFSIAYTLKFKKSKTLTPSSPTAETTKGRVFYKSIGNVQTETPTLGERYAIELKVVTKQEEAVALLNTLKAQGIEAYYTPFQSRGRVFYRIRFGSFPSRNQAEDSALRIKTAQKLPTTVIRLQ